MNNFSFAVEARHLDAMEINGAGSSSMMNHILPCHQQQMHCSEQSAAASTCIAAFKDRHAYLINSKLVPCGRTPFGDHIDVRPAYKNAHLSPTLRLCRVATQQHEQTGPSGLSARHQKSKLMSAFPCPDPPCAGPPNLPLVSVLVDSGKPTPNYEKGHSSQGRAGGGTIAPHYNGGDWLDGGEREPHIWKQQRLGPGTLTAGDGSQCFEDSEDGSPFAFGSVFA